MIWVAVILASMLPAPGPVEDRVDLIEVNHVYNAKGEHVFDQAIYYEWSSRHSCYQVRDWRLLKDDSQIPVRNWSRGDFQAVWKDGSVFRCVRTPIVRESWTQYDPEVRDRKRLPRRHRWGLTPRNPSR